MDSGNIVSVVVTVVIVLASLAVTVVSVLLSVAVPLAIAYFVIKAVKSGKATVVVSGPIADVMAQSPPAPAGPIMVKQATCRACGAPKVQRSLSAYVYCDFCGALVDWDFQACLADKRSHLPGPTYEYLLRDLGPKLAAAKQAGDRPAYLTLQERIFDAYATACPAACPPRIGDPMFKKAFVKWSAESQALQDLDPDTAASFAKQQAAVGKLAWDRSNPFQPKVEPTSFWAMMDAVVAHQRGTSELIDREGLLARHPDHPTAVLFRRIGMSAMVQGWMPYLPQSEHDRLLESTGLKDDFRKVEPPETHRGQCPHCSAPLDAVTGARRVLCYACGHMVGVGTGSLPCHACGATVELPDSGALFACPYCETELRLMR